MSQQSRGRVIVAAVALFVTINSAHAGAVRIVDPQGQRNFADIQSAIDAAVDGDVLLVGAGSYAGFTLDGKSVALFAVPASGVAITGPVIVRNVPSGWSALFVGLAVHTTDPTCLRLEHDAGDVVLEACGFTGGVVDPVITGGYSAVEVVGSPRVVFTSCTFLGGAGHWYHFIADNGAAAMRLTDARVAAYGCSFTGGRGGDGYEDPGSGGAGLTMENAWLFAAGCSMRGGDGGEGTGDAFGFTCGSGGIGLSVRAGSSARLLDVTSRGGIAGHGLDCSDGADVGGPIETLPGSARSFEAPEFSSDRSGWAVAVRGRPGDQVFLNRSLTPVFEYEAALSGVCTSVLPPFATTTPLVTLSGTGNAMLAVRQHLLPDDVVARVYFLQGYVVDGNGATILGSPMHTLTLNWNSLPDCNGNGIDDYAEVILGLTPDADHDLVPDDCP
jgi:hypothetical protein